RWNEMSAAIAKAWLTYRSLLGRPYGSDQRILWPEDDAKTLKIFMAPEFYFRGKRGAYEIDRLFYLINKVQSVTRSADFKDWLFVLGTCVCSIVPASATKAEKQVELQNYAIVQKGCFPGSDGIHDLQVLKEYPSWVDFKHTQTQKGWDAK